MEDLRAGTVLGVGSWGWEAESGRNRNRVFIELLLRRYDMVSILEKQMTFAVQGVTAKEEE